MSFWIGVSIEKEILDLGYEIVQVEDGRITFAGEEDAVARANMFIRTAERIMIKCGSFKAVTFDELFEGTKSIPWERYLTRDAKFWVSKATSNKSALFSPSDIQSIVKKAMVERLKQTYHVSWFTEDGAEYPVRVFIFKDIVTIGLDTSGVSLHKRGYRKLVGKAPISETLASALIMLTPWNKDRVLVDPFCGSGTFPIEAAMIGARIAPGIDRDFLASEWAKVGDKKMWYNAIDEANDMIDHDVKMNIQGYDLDNEMVKCAMENARAAGVDEHIHFQQRDVKYLRHPKNMALSSRIRHMVNVSRIGRIFLNYIRRSGKASRRLDDWSMFLITSYSEAEKYIGRKADKNRKIYNGMIKSYFYQFMGPKPPKRK